MKDSEGAKNNLSKMPTLRFLMRYLCFAISSQPGSIFSRVTGIVQQSQLGRRIPHGVARLRLQPPSSRGKKRRMPTMTIMQKNAALREASFSLSIALA